MAILLTPFTKQNRSFRKKLIANKCCGNCGYSDTKVYDDGSGYMLCRKNPPNADGLFPEIADDEYCGEWKSYVDRFSMNKLQMNVTFGHDTPIILDELEEQLFNEMKAKNREKTVMDEGDYNAT